MDAGRAADDASPLPATTYTDCVLPFLLAAMCSNQRVALLTLVNIEGSSPRPLGSQLAVSEDGRSAGLISGGCIEASLVRDAIAAIQDRRCYMERYGKGSRFIDLRLPCGSGIDVYFDTGIDRALIEELSAAGARREAVSLIMDIRRHRRWIAGDGLEGRDTLPPDRQQAELFIRPYRPICRVMMVGEGQIMVMLAQFCRMAERETLARTSDQATRHQLADLGFEVAMAGRWTADDCRLLDPWTAVVRLSHDHDDEEEDLALFLSTPAFYVGALGSRRTHARRCESLKRMGVPPGQIERIHGPIGLPIKAATPPEIATAILADLIAAWRTRLEAGSCSGWVKRETPLDLLRAS